MDKNIKKVKKINELNARYQMDIQTNKLKTHEKGITKNGIKRQKNSLQNISTKTKDYATL